MCNNVDFFLEYDTTDIVASDTTSQSLVKRIQDLVHNMRQTGKTENIKRTFDWLKVLCYHAYVDLGIDPTEKFKMLQTQTSEILFECIN